MKVREVMHKGGDWVDPDTPVTDLAKLMRQHDIGAIPIGENDRLIGMVTDRDIVVKAIADGKDVKTTRVGDVMSKKLVTCRADDDVDVAMKSMAQFQLRPGQTSTAVTHRTVEEIWYVLSGRGQMWRSQDGRSFMDRARFRFFIRS